MSSKEVAQLVPVFVGQDFRSWKEKMMDYLGSQKLLGFALGQHQWPAPAAAGQPTQAKLMAMAQWDEDDLQVNSLIALQLSSNLRTHLGTMSEATWTSLDQTFGTPHFTAMYKDYELAHSIKLVVGKNPQVRIQKIWTIFERLQVNGCIISNYLQGMLLLKAILKEWDRIAQMYCHGMVQANITFNGVWDAIMNEYEWIAHPTQLAHSVDKISAVKCKGQSS